MILSINAVNSIVNNVELFIKAALMNVIIYVLRQIN